MISVELLASYILVGVEREREEERDRGGGGGKNFFSLVLAD